MLNLRAMARRPMFVAKLRKPASASSRQSVIVRNASSIVSMRSGRVSRTSRFKISKATRTFIAKCVIGSACTSRGAWVRRQFSHVFAPSISKVKQLSCAIRSVMARARRRPVRSSVSRSSLHSLPPRTHPTAWSLIAFPSFRRTFVRWFSLMVVALQLQISTIFIVA